MRTFSRNSKNDERTLVQIKDVIEDTLAICEDKLRMSGIELKKDVQGENLAVLGHATQVSQVLLNLINNARDALAEEKQKEKIISVLAYGDDSHVFIKVEDNGPGVSPENREKIFQSFFTTKGLGKGTGLGLSISVQIMEFYSGQLSLDSEAKGACFVMRFPRPAREKAPLVA